MSNANTASNSSSTIRFAAQSGDGVAPSENGVFTRITSTIIDTYYGRRSAETVFRDESNAFVISYYCRDPLVRDECQKYFASRKPGKVVQNLLGHLKVVSETRCLTTSEVLAEVQKQASTNAALVIAEILIPFFRRCGLMADIAMDCVLIAYPWEPVTMASLGQDLLAAEVMRVVGDIKKVTVDTATRVTPSVLAEEVGFALMPLHRAFTDVNMLNQILTDIVFGVRAQIDPNPAFNGSVVPHWRDHVVVQALATNRVFVDAAMAIHPEQSYRPTEFALLDKWAPHVLANLRTSSRYRMVNLSEFRKEWSLDHVIDNSGYVRHAVLAQQGKVYPTGMSVVAVPDAMVDDAWTISAQPRGQDRLAAIIQAAYGSSERYSTDVAAALTLSMMNQIVSMDDEMHRGMEVTVIAVGDAPSVDPDSIAADRRTSDDVKAGFVSNEVVAYHGAMLDLVSLMSEHVIYNVDYADTASVPSIVRTFRVKTERSNIHPRYIPSGRFVGAGLWNTTSLVEALTMMPKFNATGVVADRPQLIGDKALNGRVTNFLIKTELVKADHRFAFNMKYGSLVVRGSFNLNEINSLRSSSTTYMVIPSLNREIFRTVSVAIDNLHTLVDGYNGDPAVTKTWKRMIANAVMSMAQGVTAGFRQEIHDVMVSRAVANKGFEESVRDRAQLRSRMFGGYADLYAFYVFLAAQGLATDVWLKLISDPEVIAVCLESGTERAS